MMVKGKEEGKPFSATVDIDFGHLATNVSRFYLRAFRSEWHLAEMPDKITFYYSTDGNNYVNIGNPTTLSDVTAVGCSAVYTVALDKAVSARYMRAVIESEGDRPFWINEIGAAAYTNVEYAYKGASGKIIDVNGVIYEIKGGNAVAIGFDATPDSTVATKSKADFNSDEDVYILGVGTENAVNVIPDFIGDGRINYSGVPNNIKYIIIHNTGTTEEETDAARYNRRMHTTPEENSWHYTVDENIIYHSLADSVVGWHAGTGINYESIGIEICVNGAPKKANGALVFKGEEYDEWVETRFDRSLRNTAVLVAELLTRYGLTKEAVIQHYDASEKNCPEWMRYKDGKYVYNGTLWERFMGYVDEYYGLLNTDNPKGTVVYKTEIIIPDYISFDGRIFPVTEIGGLAFADSDAPIHSITVGKEVKKIAPDAFDGNEELEIIDIRSGNLNFSVADDGTLYSTDGYAIFDPKAYKGIEPKPKDSCTLDIRNIDGKYYVFCNSERFTLAELADNFGADEFTANKIDGTLVALDEVPGTGAVLTFNGARLYLVITGDINGDANIDAYDYILIKRTCLKTYSPLKRQTLAMLLRGKDQVSVYDYIILKRHVMGTFSLY
ncbi:MAG: N-acetylmuramoyl-L-alanine amidase [Clostridia bacterium]|nr:N-acetylmuramoyl-L-alanine amidase [Clostridia bacterium]